MSHDVMLVIVGGAIALVSSFITALAQHWLALLREKQKREEELGDERRKRLSLTPQLKGIRQEVESLKDLREMLSSPSGYEGYADFYPMDVMPLPYPEKRRLSYEGTAHFTLGNDKLRDAVALVLPKLPFGVIAHMLADCRLFLMPEAKGKGIYLPAELLEEKAIIALPEALLDGPEELERTILHQVAHFSLNHKVPTISDLSDEEYDQQEAEAEELVKRWLEGGSVS